MGCASSKHQQRCRHCRSPYSPVHRRSYSMHSRQHQQEDHGGDGHHVVALTSSTLGSIKLDARNRNIHINATIPINDAVTNRISDSYKGFHTIRDDDDGDDGDDERRRSKEFSMGVIEAKTWSSMIEEKIPKSVPKTPIRTPPGEPETINAWELMEGLEDISPLRPFNHKRSFSFDLVPKERTVSVSPITLDQPKSPVRQPLWLQMEDDDRGESNRISETNSKSMMCEFDPDIISTFKKALDELSPAKLSPGHSFHRKVDDTDDLFGSRRSKDANACKWGLHQKNKVVVYFTSLRGVRKTYEDCCNVRTILKGSGFRIDERDVSMHSGFKEELKELLGDRFGIALPRVFVASRLIGGAEEVRRMHEEGQLEKALEGCEMADDGRMDGGRVCEACGDVRFVPCETCSGSCKVYYDCEDEEYGEEDEEYGFRRCPDCNENGIIRCPICCD